MYTISMLICLLAGEPTLASTPTPAADGTVSVLTKQVQDAPTAAPAVASTVVAAPAEQARGVRLSPWHVRRLNRIADRQEVRDAKNCCCDSCRDDKVLLLKPASKCGCNCNCR